MDRLAALAGWRRAGLAVLLGVAATLATPPLCIVPLAFVAFTGLALLHASATGARRWFWDGWWFGFAHFTTSLYWMSEAMLVDPLQFGWIIPFSLFGFPAFLGLFTGAVMLLAAWLPGGRTAPGRPFAIAASWTLAEWIRGHILTGFPWNLIGYVWSGADVMLQPAALIGIYGMSVLTVWLAALPAVLIGPRRPALTLLALGAAVLLGLGAWSAWRLPAQPTAELPGIRFRLVQVAVDQKLKWKSDMREEILLRHLQLSQSAGAEAVTHLVWPEAAVTYYLADDAPARELVSRLVHPDGLLLSGIIRREIDPARPFRVWNSFVAIDAAARVRGVYDKHHLVPFGEYVPARWLLDVIGMQKLVPGPLDFSAGPGPRTLELPGLPPVSPLICYEAIFPAQVVAPGLRPGWLLTVTNDGWFGMTSGPHQHFAMARMRAVEQGLPLVRAANSGISGIVDPYGRVTVTLRLGARGVIDGGLPAALPTTLYAVWGDGPAFALWLIIVTACWLAGRYQLRADREALTDTL
jgi:apolipoprotein N-acyltransferase